MKSRSRPAGATLLSDTTIGVGMTREAKIGLLVALAFILVIGILLSDHVTTATRPPTAPLADIEASIKGGITAPGASGNATQTPPRLPEQVASNETLPYVHPQPSDIALGVCQPLQHGFLARRRHGQQAAR